MIRNSLLALFFVVAMSFNVFGQTGPVRGIVELIQDDGKKVPVAGALIEVFRSDQKGKFPSAKTDKKGAFVFAGLPFGATFTLSVSAVGISPKTFAGVKAGAEDIKISVSSGDGKRLTEDEVRSSLSAPTQGNGSGEMSAADKKKFEEEQKKIAQIKANNAKIEESNKIILRVYSEGHDALKAGNLDIAVAKFSEGVAADPEREHPGTPALLNSKSIALRRRGVDRYNQAIKNGGQGLDEARQDLTESASAAKMSIDLLKSRTAPTEADQLKNFNGYRYEGQVAYSEAMRLVAKIVDQSRAAEMIVAYEEYFALETDSVKKLATQGVFAQALMDAQEFEKAVVEFEKILVQDPVNTNALSGAGLCLINLGYINNDKVKFQSAANYLARYVELAPDTDKYKADAKGFLETLKKEQNVTAQKPTKVAPPKKKP